MKDVDAEEGDLDCRKEKEEREEHYEGPWWRFPPMRNALASGALLALGSAFSFMDAVPEWLSIAFYIAGRRSP